MTPNTLQAHRARNVVQPRRGYGYRPLAPGPPHRCRIVQLSLCGIAAAVPILTGLRFCSPSSAASRLDSLRTVSSTSLTTNTMRREIETNI